MCKIINVGSLNMDLVVSTSKIPAAGETIIGDDFMTSPGGKGANQAVAAARLEGEVVMIGCVGDDIFGEKLLTNLKENNVNVDNIKTVTGVSTGVAVIILNNSDNRIIVSSGANFKITDNDIDIINEIGQKDDILLTQLEVPISVVSKALRAAKEKNMTTILDPAPAKKLNDEIYSNIDIITPNESESEFLTGIKISDKESMEKSINFFQDKGVERVIITLGKKGVVYNDKKQVIFKSVPKVDVVDTTGAGDSFCGALAVCLAKGLDIKESISFCNKVGTLTVMKKGAQKSLPYLKEVKNFSNS